MIRYPISLAKLNSQIGEISPTWPARSLQKTQALKSRTFPYRKHKAKLRLRIQRK